MLGKGVRGCPSVIQPYFNVSPPLSTISVCVGGSVMGTVAAGAAAAAAAAVFAGVFAEAVLRLVVVDLFNAAAAVVLFFLVADTLGEDFDAGDDLDASVGRFRLFDDAAGNALFFSAAVSVVLAVVIFTT
jgi:hypothetical protein